jgi:DNA-directed RNA polymerase delta subunit
MNTKYIQNKKVIQSKIGEEIVMLDMDSGFYFGLNSVASTIWEKLENPISFQEIINELLKEYKIDQETCENDTMILLNQLLEKNIIKQVL